MPGGTSSISPDETSTRKDSGAALPHVPELLWWNSWTSTSLACHTTPECLWGLLPSVFIPSAHASVCLPTVTVVLFDVTEMPATMEGGWKSQAHERATASA
eukprot:621475-Amphidinium_carterae.1